MTGTSSDYYGPTEIYREHTAPIEDANGKSSKKDKKIRSLDTVTVIAEYKSDKVNILNLSIGDTINVLTKTESGWWDGVIFHEDSTSRGWFPNTHTKPIIPPLNDSQNFGSQSNRFLNLSALLRQNLNEDTPRTRKNSSVSFASSDHSIPSQVTSKSPYESSPSVNLTEINLVSAQEVEAIFSSTGSSNVPIWTPIATNENTIVYYNSELNVYCKQLPYISNPEVEENSKIVIPSLSDDPTPLTTVNSNDLKPHQVQPSYRNIKSRPSTTTTVTTGYDSRKGSTKESSRSRSSVPSNLIVGHPWNTALYSEPELFYYDPSDIRTWSGLRDAFKHFLDLTLDAITKHMITPFHIYFNIASRLATLIHLAARLAQHDLQDSTHRGRVQKRLKKIGTSIAQLGINGNLYLTEVYNRRKSTKDTIKADDIEYQSSEEKTIDEELNFEINSDFLNQVQTEIESLKKSATTCIKIFVQISSNLNNQNCLPQIYPRFLNGFFSGGNWKNPFVSNPKDLFNGRDSVKSLHHKRVPRFILRKETYSELEVKKNQLRDSLAEVLDILRGQENNQSRNVDILSKLNKSLTISSGYIDILEGLDFQVFLNNNSTDFDPSKLIYSILTEFFESKQHLRDIFVTIIMESQNITLTDPTVFSSIREDRVEYDKSVYQVEPEKTAKALEAELTKFDAEFNNSISIDVDKNLIHSILKSFDLLEISQTLVSQLISEREALLSYATRVMDDFQYEFYPDEREDSTVTQEEYALPASTTNRQGGKNSDNLPWYLDTEEYNLIFTNNDTIKGGTREALIQRLTHHVLLDASFNFVFLTSFRSMMKPTQLIDLLIKRFNLEPPENLSYEEYTDWVEKKSSTIKARVVNIMKSLLQKYWIPSYNDQKLIDKWLPFIEILINESFAGSEQLKKDFNKNVLEPVQKGHDQLRDKHILYSSRVKKAKVLDIDSAEFANQLTIKDSALYSKIPQIECLDKSWNNKYGSLGGFQNLQKFISNSNDLTNFVSTQILSHNDIKKRVNVIRYFVEVAEKCRKLNNFSSMTAIISALYSSPIHRLKKTWSIVPQFSLDTMNKMNDLMNSSRNFAEYREVLRGISDLPCVPFLGVFLSDLTFTTNGNPDHLHGDPKLINFAKRVKTVDILREISRYQDLKYNLKKFADLQDIISYRLTTGLTIDEQYNRSLVIEPRVKVSQQIQTNQKGSISSVATVTNQSSISRQTKQSKFFPSFPPPV